MRFRFGFVLGFGSGYYLGAKAGRARYEQLRDVLDRVRRSEAYEATADKTRALVDQQAERVKEAVEERVEVAKEVVEERVGHAKEVLEERVEVAKEVVEERVARAKDVAQEQQDANGRQAAPGSADAVVSDLPPGPPPAGSLSDDRPPGGPPV